MLLNRRTVLVVAATAVVSCSNESPSDDNSDFSNGLGVGSLQIGRPCDVLADASTIQAVYNPSALECPSRICLKPDVQPGGTAVGNPTNFPPLLPTGPYCSAMCSKDSDCTGQKRDLKNGSDARCMSGYTCGVVFSVGPFCCKKLCLCKDFYNLDQAGGLETPVICDQTPNGCLE